MNGSRQIFIVEDDEMYSLMLDYLLSENPSWRFVRFTSGEECLSNLYLNPEVVILDYGLPGMNGYDTLVQIKERMPHVHVLILTNRMDAELSAELRQAGAEDYIIKQRDSGDQIRQKIENLLESEAAHRQSGLNHHPLS